MLVSFKIKNFKSFKDENQLNLTAGSTRQKQERIQQFNYLDVLKFSAIFGANASGKSNIVTALAIMRYLVLRNKLPLDSLNEFYRLDDSCSKEPTYFEVIITIDNKIYDYGFEVSLVNNNYSSEWLIELKYNRDHQIKENIIFEKEKGKIKFPLLPKENKEKQNRINVYKEDIEADPNVLFLNKLCTTNDLLFVDPNDELIVIKKVFNWFNSNLAVISPNLPFTAPEYITDAPKLHSVVNLLKSFDTGIQDVQEVNVKEEDFRRRVSSELDVDKIKEQMAKQKSLQLLSKKIDGISLMLRNNSNYWTICLDKNNEFKFLNLVFYHDKENKYPFTLQDESDGTLRIFDLAEVLLANPDNKVFIIDELDRCLHPSLTLQFIRLFLKEASCPTFTNQLIVTTHESRLMDLDILRRDEIWFTKKDKGISSLYSLEDYNERFDKVIDKAYLNGRYGGIPVFDSVFLPECLKK